MTIQSQQLAAIRMLSIDECADLGNVSRGTINNRIRAWDKAIEAGETPPPGALESYTLGRQETRS